jgi:hypothetical protein
VLLPATHADQAVATARREGDRVIQAAAEWKRGFLLLLLNRADAQSDKHPLLAQTAVACGSGTCAETVRFQIYEYLPATSANLALLDLRAQHPGARSVAELSSGNAEVTEHQQVNEHP